MGQRIRRRMRAALSFVLTVIVWAGALAPAASARVARPRPDTLEYQRSWGLNAIGAQAAYAAGYTGRGVRIALIDCGLDGRRRDLKRNVSGESVDLIPQRLLPLDDPHGSWVAQPLGSQLNGYGTVGVAYNATLLEIRADMDGGHDGECAFWAKDLARAIDYAIDRQARIVVLPVQARHPLGDAFEAALGKAAASGAVIVAAAGNRSEGEPAYPAAYATDPRFARNMVVVGAAGYDGEITKWTNRAGSAGGRFILAPGEWILTDCRTRRCQLASGTSFAAPFVAGAIALAMEAHPQLDGSAAADAVLGAARDLGPAGVDPVYGHGMLDIGRLFPPQKTARAP